MMDERYLAELKAVAKEDSSPNIPDKVKDYTTDIHGKPLPCEFVQLNEQLDYHIQKIPKHIAAGNDYFGLCFGYPGAGKTHLMERICLRLNADFGLKDITFTVSQLDEWILTAKEGSIGLFDEADVMSDGYYDKVLRALIRNMQRIRTKKLILFFCTPTMKDMHHYFAFRAKMVLYSFVPKNKPPSERGWIHLWHDQDLIADLFARMKKAYSENSRVYDAAYCTLKNKYIGTKVPKDWPIDIDAYEKKKELARQALEADGGLTPNQAVQRFRDRTVIPRLEALRHEVMNSYESGKPFKWNQKIAADIVDLSRARYSEIYGGAL